MYCTAKDILEISSDPVKIAKNLRVDVPDVMSIEDRNNFIAKIDDTKKTLFNKFYILDVNKYKLNNKNSDTDKISLVELFIEVSGKKSLEKHIQGAVNDIDVALSTGGYETPIESDSKNYSVVSDWAINLTLYRILINSGVKNESEADKQFIDYCKEIKTTLKLIAEGKYKLPYETDGEIVIKTTPKIFDKMAYDRIP